MRTSIYVPPSLCERMAKAKPKPNWSEIFQQAAKDYLNTYHDPLSVWKPPAPIVRL